jgi:hypothetical protein
LANMQDGSSMAASDGQSTSGSDADAPVADSAVEPASDAAPPDALVDPWDADRPDAPDPSVSDASQPDAATVTLTIAIVGDGTLERDPEGAPCGSGCSAYSAGTRVSLRAASPPGVRLVRVHNETYDCRESPCTLRIFGDVSVTALFEGGGTVQQKLLPIATGHLYTSGAGQDDTNAVVVGGGFTGAMDFGDGQFVITSSSNVVGFVVKFAADGAFVWKKIITSGERSTGVENVLVGPNRSVVVGGNFGALAGEATATGFLQKFASTGTELWTRTWPCATVSAASLDDAGNVFFGGSYVGSCRFDSDTNLVGVPHWDGYVARLRADGSEVDWAVAIRASEFSGISAVVASPDGAHVIVGSIVHGSVALGGTAFTATEGDSVLLRYAGDTGDYVWSRAFPTSCRTDAGPRVAVDREGHMIIGGTTTCAIDLGQGPLTPAGSSAGYVARLAEDGASLWSKMFADSFAVVGVGVAGQGDVLVAPVGVQLNVGGVQLTSPSGHFMVKLAPDGAYRWSRGMMGVVRTIAPAPDDRTLVTGEELGNGPLRIETLAP